IHKSVLDKEQDPISQLAVGHYPLAPTRVPHKTVIEEIWAVHSLRVPLRPAGLNHCLRVLVSWDLPGFRCITSEFGKTDVERPTTKFVDELLQARLVEIQAAETIERYFHQTVDFLCPGLLTDPQLCQPLLDFALLNLSERLL